MISCEISKFDLYTRSTFIRVHTAESVKSRCTNGWVAMSLKYTHRYLTKKTPYAWSVNLITRNELLWKLGLGHLQRRQWKTSNSLFSRFQEQIFLPYRFSLLALLADNRKLAFRRQTSRHLIIYELSSTMRA